MESLRHVIGGDIIPDVTSTVQPYRSGPESFRTRLIEPPAPFVAGLDTYVGILPKAEVRADFFEFVLVDDHLAVAIGDVPSIGLKSAFAARFLGNMFRRMVLNRTAPISGIFLEI